MSPVKIHAKTIDDPIDDPSMDYAGAISGIPRSQEWKKLVGPKFHRGFDFLMSYLREVAKTGNPKGLRLAIELSKKADQPIEGWAIDMCIDLLKEGARNLKYTKGWQQEQRRRMRKLEIWNAVNTRLDSGSKKMAAYLEAKTLLQTTGFNPPEPQRISKIFSEVEKILDDKELRSQCRVAAIPSPEEMPDLYHTI